MKATVDGRDVLFEANDSILDVCAKAGIDVPTLCYLKGLPPQASCFVCVVRVEGRKRLLPACATKCEDGMAIDASSDAVRQARRVALELLLSDHVGDCMGPCQSVCPAHMDIPDMVRHITNKDYAAAIRVVKEAIALPATLGRICPELCEKGCRRRTKDGPVAICRLKRFVADKDLSRPDPYLPPVDPTSGKRVAVIGAGPAGLAAAYHLAALGHAVEMFDPGDKPGGALRNAVPKEVLPRETLDAEIGVILRLGVRFTGGVTVQGSGLEDYIERFDAVFLGTGPSSHTLFPSLESTETGLRVDRATQQTSRKGVFAGGSALAPSHHAVRAVADGKKAAFSIDQFLRTGKTVPTGPSFSVHAGKIDADHLQPYMNLVNPAPRTEPGSDQSGGFSEFEAVAEAQRCLRCACTTRNQCKLRRYAIEYGAKTNLFQGHRRAPEIDASHPDLLFEPGKCISCGICVRIAQEESSASGLTFVGRGFDMRIGVPFGDLLANALHDTAKRCAEACPTSALMLKAWLKDPDAS